MSDVCTVGELIEILNELPPATPLYEYQSKDSLQGIDIISGESEGEIDKALLIFNNLTESD